MEIVFLEFKAESENVEDANERGEFVPCYSLIYSLEDLDQDPAWERGLETASLFVIGDAREMHGKGTP